MSPRLRDLSTWSSVDAAAWVGVEPYWRKYITGLCFQSILCLEFVVKNVVSQQPAPVPCCNSSSTTMDSPSETIRRASSSFYKQPLFTTIDHSNRIVTNIPSSAFFQNKIEFYSPQIACQLKDSYFFPSRLLLIWGINSM